MIGEKELKLANILIHSTSPLSSTNLAEMLKVSPRSIRNYIAQLNAYSELDVVISTNNGYLGIKQNLKTLIDQTNTNSIPQTADERIRYIIKKVLFDHENQNILDLSIQLFVSESTLKADIMKINKRYSTSDVKFYLDVQTIKVIGDEKNLRKLMSKIILSESSNNYLEIQKIQENFQSIDIEELYKTLNVVFDSEAYYINEYSKLNVLLHIAILIDRIRNQRSITKEYKPDLITLSEEKELTETLILQLQKLFTIRFNDYEKTELLYIIRSNVNFFSNMDKDTFDKRTGADPQKLE